MVINTKGGGPQRPTTGASEGVPLTTDTGLRMLTQHQHQIADYKEPLRKPWIFLPFFLIDIRDGDCTTWRQRPREQR